MLLSPSDVLKKGLKGLQFEGNLAAMRTQQFHPHYGSSPLDLADMWYDLTVTTILVAELTDKEKSEEGFKMFLAAHYFLWTYPKNSNLLASQFGICERY
mgnify:CR=1 FL=1